MYRSGSSVRLSDSNHGGRAHVDYVTFSTEQGGRDLGLRLAGRIVAPDHRAVLEQLEPEVREIAVCRLMGYRNREIAERLKCTERKIERKLQLIRLAWEAAWPA